MKDFEWDLPFRANYLFLRFNGLWPKSDSYKMDIYTTYTITISIFFIYAENIFQFVNIFFIDDLNKAGNVIFIAFCEIVAVFKLHVVIGKMYLVKNLFKEMKSEVFQPLNSNQIVLARSAIKMVKNIYWLFFYVGITTLFFFSFYPILDGTYQNYRLPFAVWYPFDYKKSPLYEIMYVHQVISTFYIATLNLNVDCLISTLMGFVAAQCDILCDKFEHLQYDKKTEESLIGCVIHHQKILR